MEKVLTKKEVMEALRIGRYTFERLANEDPDFRTLKLGHRRVMTERALDDFIKAKGGQ